MKVLGICSGNGVILHPFRNKHLIGSIEPRVIFHSNKSIQWELNFSQPFDTSTKVVYSKANVIIGAPDCGHSSVLSYSRAKKMSNPEDNESLSFFVQSVLRYRPDVFLMENLPRLLDVMGAELQEAFKDYTLIRYVEPVSAWGNSQVSRVRLVIVGVRQTLPTKALSYFKLPSKVKLKTCAELYNDLPELYTPLCHVREPDEQEICLWYKGKSKVTVAKARELWTTEFAHLKRWPTGLDRMKNQPGVYRNLDDDYPLTVRKQNRQFNQAGFMLSPREMARIQGVPDTFKLYYDDERLTYCINKARTTVTKSPPYEIGKWFKDCLVEMYKNI